MLNWLFRKRASDMGPTPEQIDLLGTVTIPNPDVLLADLRRVQERSADADREWNRFDQGNPRAVLRQPELAREMLALAKEEERITAAISDARRRRAAFLDVADYQQAISHQTQALLDSLVDQPPADDDERRQVLQLLGDLDRLDARLRMNLRAVSTDRRFKEPVSALSRLKDLLEARIREIDRLPMRVPGLKPRFTMPEDIASLLDALEGRTPRRGDVAHAI